MQLKLITMSVQAWWWVPPKSSQSGEHVPARSHNHFWLANHKHIPNPTMSQKKVRRIRQETNVGDALVWEAVKNNNSFQVRARGTDNIILTREPGNLTQRSTSRSSGLNQHNIVGLEAGDKRSVVLTLGRRQARASSKPSTARVTTRLNSGYRKDISAVERLVSEKRHDLVCNDRIELCTDLCLNFVVCRGSLAHIQGLRRQETLPAPE